MNARMVLNGVFATILTGTLAMSAALIWLAAAQPEDLAAAHVERGWAGLVLTVASFVLNAAGRALTAIW